MDDNKRAFRLFGSAIAHSCRFDGKVDGGRLMGASAVRPRLVKEDVNATAPGLPAMLARTQRMTLARERLLKQ